jgi:hypothetical protein
VSARLAISAIFQPVRSVSVMRSYAAVNEEVVKRYEEWLVRVACGMRVTSNFATHLLDDRGNRKLATMSDYTCDLRRQTHRLGD